MIAYAEVADVWTLGIKQAALSSVATPVIEAELERQARKIDSYLAALGALPLVAWGADIRGANVVLAVPNLLLGMRGANPDEPGVAFWIDRATKEELWLRDVSRGIASPVGLVFSTPTPIAEAAPQVFTTKMRGW